jgi:hypothetical protein
VVKVEIRRSSYEAPVMKYLSIFGLAPVIVLASLAFTPISAQATTVSADCQKVKVKVMAYEAKERDFAKAYAPVNGKWSWFFASAHLNDYWLLQKKIVDYEVTMFTYDLTNLPCFTLKQQAYAKVVFKEWKDLQTFLKVQPDWIAGFNFVPIVWDSIYDKDLVSPIP